MDQRISSFFFMFLLIISANSVFSQNWIFKSVAVSDEGIYAVTENNTLVKLTESLKPLWAVEIQKNAYIERLIPAGNGVLLLGDVLAEIDGNGTLLWAKNLSVDEAETLPNGDVVFLIDNTVGLIGRNGKILWTNWIFLNGTDEQTPRLNIRLVAPLKDAILLSGVINLPDDPKSHLFLGALSLNGTPLWAKILNTGYYDYPDTAIPTGNSGIVAGIYGGGSDAPWIADYFALKVSPDGEIEWFKSYLCPRGENWDAFWTMKIQGGFCDGGICAVDTTTGTFIINSAGEPLTYPNVSGKVHGIVNDSLLILSNGTILTAPLKRYGEPEKCYATTIRFKEKPVEIKVSPKKFNASDVNLSVIRLQNEEEPGKNESLEKENDKKSKNSPEWESKGKNYYSIALAALILTGIALTVFRKTRR